MTHVEPDIQSILGERYSVVREIGRGGMATVFLATDHRHGRQVAVKVLHGGITQGPDRERFSREIRIVAALTHPHILPLHDSGEVGGSLYYVMPYVEGETLRHRLVRETRLPVSDAVRLARQVAEALHYAHSRGVVHRDIKPENILLTGNDALVADFGIARAVSSAASLDTRLTQAGLTVGTALYMSPEQASGLTELDGRSDVYSLACLLFELLIGEPVFPGRSFVEVLSAHASSPVRSLSALRKDVPEGLNDVVHHALEKNPANRFQSADEFAAALAPFEVASGEYAHTASRLTSWRTGVRPVARKNRHARALWIGAALLVTLGLLGVFWRSQEVTALDARAIVVMPFRVNGADASLSYLREGMLDLLAAKMSGEGFPASIDPRAVMSAFRRAAGDEERDLQPEAAREMARGLGAGRLLLGSVVGTPSRLVLSASLESTDGVLTSSRVSVVGPADSLPHLVDQLAAQLLALGAGEGVQRLEAVTSTSFVALRAYLAGRASYREARYQESVEHFKSALAADSSFALAALGLRLAAGWIGSPDIAYAGHRAWELQSRLPTRDRALLAGLVGPRYPGYSSELEVLDAWERAVGVAPDLPEAWYEYGDQLYHAGAMMGMRDAQERAATAFNRSLALDSAFAPALFHMVEIAARNGNRAQLERMNALYTATNLSDETLDFLRWRMASALGDSASLRALRARMQRMNPESLRRIVVAAQLDGVAGDDADTAAVGWLAAHRAPELRWFALLRVHDLLLNRGDAAGALALTDSMRRLRNGSHAWQRLQVEDALYGGGDSAAGVRSVTALMPFADAELAKDAEDRAEQYADMCTVWQWRLQRVVAPPRGVAGSTSASNVEARAAIAALRASTSSADGVETAAQNAWCALALEAMIDPARLAQLDSVLQTGPRPMETSRSRLFRTFMMGNLLAARLHERALEPASALAAVRRRPLHGAGTVYLRSALQLEERLATQLGDQAGAAAARRHRLAIENRTFAP
jgi:serine/threonine-protein kinase